MSATLIHKTQQKEQESFFGKLFKTGWGSSEKESKQKDPRSTVNPMGGDMGMWNMYKMYNCFSFKFRIYLLMLL